MTDASAGNAPAGKPPRNLAEALAALQGRLPRIAKTETAKVDHKDGGYHQYSYADLAGVTHQIMPIMSELGLSFTCAPTLLFNDDHPEIAPKFVLRYRLRHTSGDAEEGLYPLPAGVGPQATGGAITYARRYCLCAVTGIATEDDDDAAAAEAGLRRQAREALPQQPREPQQRQAQQQRPDGRLRRAPEQNGQKPEQNGREPSPPEPDKRAQALADLAGQIAMAKDKTLGDLQEQVYKPAMARRILRAQVIDPVTGERTQLTTVINAAKAHMEAAAAEAAKAGAAQS